MTLFTGAACGDFDSTRVSRGDTLGGVSDDNENKNAAKEIWLSRRDVSRSDDQVVRCLFGRASSVHLSLLRLSQGRWR